MDIWKYFIGSSSIAVVLILIARWIINKTFDVGLTKYKGELEKELAIHIKELDKERAIHLKELEKSQLEHRVKFSKLHEDRAQRIADCYTKIIDLEKFFWTIPIDRAGSDQAIRELRDRLQKDKIYFPENTVEMIEKLIISVNTIKGEISMADNENDHIRRNKAISKITTEFKPLKDELTNQFRDFLGL